MTHDNARDALEYAALLLEQQDAGGTLPGTLRQIADSHDGLLDACENEVPQLANMAKMIDPELTAQIMEVIYAAIAAARGKEEA